MWRFKDNIHVLMCPYDDNSFHFVIKIFFNSFTCEPDRQKYKLNLKWIAFLCRFMYPALGTCDSLTWVGTQGVCEPQPSELVRNAYVFILLVQGVSDTKFWALEPLTLSVWKFQNSSVPKRGSKQTFSIHSKF